MDRPDEAKTATTRRMELILNHYTAHQTRYFAWELSRKRASSEQDRLSQSLFDAHVDVNPHQIEAALFALNNPLSKGVILADEVGLRLIKTC